MSYLDCLSFSSLQIDYNLYGMGHVHLSKMKFRHPVPDVYTMRTFTRNILHGLEMENLTCMSADFQVIHVSFLAICFWDILESINTGCLL